METAHSRSELPWDVFLRRTIGEDLVLLYQSAQGANAFPREFFASDADWQAFVELVRRRVPERAAAGRGGRPATLKVFLLWLVVFAIVIRVWNLVDEGGATRSLPFNRPPEPPSIQPALKHPSPAVTSASGS